MRQTKNLFIKWFILFAAIIAAGCIASLMGAFSLIIAGDISHLTTIIGVLFLLFTLFAGRLSYDLSKERITQLSLKRKLRVLNFAADSFFVLGLLGTIIGFCYMMHGTLNANIDVSTIIAQLKVGSSTKLYATLSGLVSSLLLQLQILVIEVDLLES